MKKPILIFGLLLSLVLGACKGNSATNEDQGNKAVNMPQDLIMIHAKNLPANHLDDQAGTIELQVNKDALASLIQSGFAQNLAINISTEDAKGLVQSLSHNNFIIDNSDLQKVDVFSVLVIPKNHNLRKNGGGVVKFNLNVNGVAQTSSLALRISHREFTDFSFEKVQFFNHHYSAHYQVNSDDAADDFQVQTSANDGLQLDEGNICHVVGNAECKVGYQVPGAAADVSRQDFHLQRQLIDDESFPIKESRFTAHKEGMPILTLNSVGNSNYLDYDHTELDLNLHVENFDDSKAKTVDIAVSSPVKTFIQDINPINITQNGDYLFHVGLNEDGRHNIDYIDDFIVYGQYDKTQTNSIVIKNATVPGINMSKAGTPVKDKMTLFSGDNTFEFKLHRLSAQDLQFHLVNQDDADVKGVSFNFNPASELFRINIADGIDTKASYKFLVKNTKTGKNEKINGSDKAIAVTIQKIIPPLKFQFFPKQKHVLASHDHAADIFYIKIANDTASLLQRRIKLQAGSPKLVLKADAQNLSCEDVMVQPLAADAKLGTPCSLTAADGPECSCELDESGKITNSLCAFAVRMQQSEYQNPDRNCKLHLEVENEDKRTSVDGSMSVVSVTGLPEVRITANGDRVPSAHYIEIYSYNNLASNPAWVTPLNSETIANGTLFKDDILTNITEKDFVYQNNSFIIKAYPKRNIEDATNVIFPTNLQLVLGYFRVDNSNWSNNKCPDGVYTNIGCNGKPAYLTAGAIVIKDKNRVIGRNDNNDFMLDSSWSNQILQVNKHKVQTVGDGSSKTVNFYLNS